MTKPGHENGVHSHDADMSSKPTYALDHLATFKIKNESEILNPKEKMKVLMDLDKSGGIWPQKMFMSFSGQWLVMLDSELKEIENFPGSLIKEPTAFISDDPLEAFNNILIFSVPGISLGMTEMHFFQVTDVSSVLLVEDLKEMSNGKVITVDHNENPIRLPKHGKALKDQYGIALAAAEVAAEKNAHDREQSERDVKVLNHCFEDIERFVARLRYAAEALRELELRKDEHNPHGEGLLIMRSRPPLESEFVDILSKHKLGLNFVTKLQNHFSNIQDPIHNLFTSLETIVNVCNDVYIGADLPENVVNPLLRRETVALLNANLKAKEMDFWRSLGLNWTQPKDQFQGHIGSFHPIFYDDWSPDWVVDEDVPFLPSAIKKALPSPPLKSPKKDMTWFSRLQSRNVKIAEVNSHKIASNDKELGVTKGEYLEILDDSRNWWKARNSAGRVGYVPSTIVTAINFEHHPSGPERDTESISSSMIDNEFNFVSNMEAHNGNHNNNYRHTMAPYAAVAEREYAQAKRSPSKAGMPRSYSMPPEVPVPPPLPPQTDSETTTPSGTLKREGAGRQLIVMRPRTEYDVNDEAILLQSNVNDELKYALSQREQRKDLEILTTPQVYISQKSTPAEVKEWLAAKGFSEAIIRKLGVLDGEELFALKPHVIEGYFGQSGSRRLISQLLLQKNMCDYKTVRSTELNAKLAKARQKADGDNNDTF